MILFLKKKNLVTALSRTKKSEIYCTGIQIINPKKINQKIRISNDFKTLWKRLIKIKELYVSNIFPKKWYSVDNVENYNFIKKIKI